MCGIGSLISGGSSLIGGAASIRAARIQADAIEDADERRSQRTEEAIAEFNESSPTARLNNTYGKSITDQVASLLGLSANQPAAAQTQSFSPTASGIISSQRPGQTGTTTTPSRAKTGRTEGVPASQLITGTSSPTSAEPTSTLPTAQQTVASLPGYEFELGEGLRTVRSHLSNQGGLYSGKALRAITEYGQNFASTKYQSHLDNAFRALGAGDSAATATLNATTQNAAASFAATEAAAGHRNDGAAGLISGFTGAAGAAAAALAPPTVEPVAG